MTEGNVEFEPKSVSREALATLGEGHIAYVKQIRSEDVPGLFPQAPAIAPGLKLFALHAADGTPISLTHGRKAAVVMVGGDEFDRLQRPVTGRDIVTVLAASPLAKVKFDRLTIKSKVRNIDL